MEARFLLLSEVATELNVSDSQVYHMVRSGELPAIKIGGRGQWRVEASKLEEYIAQQYDETRRFVEAHPFAEEDVDAWRGQWRVERARLEDYIEHKYAETADWVRQNPLTDRDPD